MAKASVRGFIFFVLLICYGCGAGMIYRTSQNDMQPMTFEEAKKKAVSLFLEEGCLSVGSFYCFARKSFKVNENGFTVICDKGNPLNYDFEFISDPVVKDYGSLAKFHYAVELRGGNDVGFEFDKKESAITFAKAFYTLKHRSAEVRTAKKQAALQSKKISKITARPIPVEKQVSVKSDIDEIPTFGVEPRRNDFAVVIGIENYRSLPKSDYSGNDATLVKSYLKSLGFQERNIDFITDGRATKTDMEKSLEAWLPNRAKKNSTIFVYFSGHGAPEPATGEAYMVPYDGDPNYLSVTGYSLKRFYERLGKLEAREIIVVLDSCFSGAGGRSVLAKGARPLVMMGPAEALPSNMAVLAATQGSQISTSSPDKGHGVFTYYFLKALKDGKKNIAEIYYYIKPLVEDEAKTMNVRQTPSLSPDAEQLKGRFVLKR
jgi:Caspase domain